MTYCKQQIPDEFYIPTKEQVPIEISGNINYINAKKQKDRLHELYYLRCERLRKGEFHD